MNTAHQRNLSVDLAKYVAALMVVAIHTNLFADINESFHFFVVHIVCSLAVPFFAVCTGFYLTEKLTFDKTLSGTKNNRLVFAVQFKKLLRLYVIWTLLYLFFSIPTWINIGWFSLAAFIDFGVATLTQGSHYHFWYLWGIIYTLPIFYLLLRIVNTRLLKPTVVILWAIEVIFYAYKSFLPETVSGFLVKLDMLNVGVRILSLLLLGSIIRLETHKSSKQLWCGFILSFLLLTAEAFTLNHLGLENVSYIVFTMPAAYFLSHLILTWKLPTTNTLSKKLRFLSLFVYCAHPMLVEITEPAQMHSTLHFVVASAGSTILGLLWLHVGERFKKTRSETI